jgi:hypothetical protein
VVGGSFGEEFEFVLWMEEKVSVIVRFQASVSECRREDYEFL